MHENIKSGLLKIFREVMEDDTFTDAVWQKNLFELGMTSIQYLKLVVSIEEEFGFEINENTFDFSDYLTLASLAELIEQRTLSA